ncbi:hypothetical protein PR202_gb29359 [Eleusine coracana subsp. coracana]|uniref:Uncharacterized protein n=1 Tax=Eleusine coracana subsp. coracana TaxID=191504 RepID=A0AAV5G0B3_ELECO|nr:hypothetical protein PR202_gb29359 [Eleusine coracana subsp. coracana]
MAAMCSWWAPTLSPPRAALEPTPVEATVAIMGEPRCVTNILSLLHDDEGLYDTLHDDVIIDLELSFLTAAISASRLAPVWSTRDNLIFFDGRLYILASSAHLHRL